MEKAIKDLEDKNSEIEKLTKRLNDTIDMHRNLKLKEKKLTTANSTMKEELDELRYKHDSLKMEHEMTVSNSENDLNMLVEQRKGLEDE